MRLHLGRKISITISDICDVTVIIPFNIINSIFCQNLINSCLDVGYDIRICKVEHQLITRISMTTTFSLNSPIWMRTIKITINRNHFWFKPQTKFQTFGMHFSNQVIQRSTEFFFVDNPVTKRTIIIKSITKPTVIKNKKLDTKFACFVS